MNFSIILHIFLLLKLKREGFQIEFLYNAHTLFISHDINHH